MKIESKSLMLAAAAMAGLLTGCATHAEQKKSCPACAAKSDKASCGAKSNCSSKHTCRAKGNCGAKTGS